MLFIFSIPVLFRYLWQLKTFVFLHWYIISIVLLLVHFSSIFQFHLLAMVEKPKTEVHTDKGLPPSVLSGRVSHSNSGHRSVS